MKLLWRSSYKTTKFDTIDGDLDKGQYAKHPVKGWYVRRHPKNNFQFVHVPELDSALDTQEVNILSQQYAYYDEFIDPTDNRILRFPSNSQKYHALGEKNAPPLAKELSTSELTAIKKNDSQWRDIIWR